MLTRLCSLKKPTWQTIVYPEGCFALRAYSNPKRSCEGSNQNNLDDFHLRSDSGKNSGNSDFFLDKATPALV